MTAARTFEQWLDALITATPEDRRMLAIEGSDEGLALRKVRCKRHKLALNWTSAFQHLDRTEGFHRLAEGSEARLHQPGDLVAAPDPRTTSTCRRCHRPVLWVRTAAGGKFPVDVEPSPAGTVVLTTDPDAPGEAPLAMFLTRDNPSAPADSIHAQHSTTCRPKRGRR